MAAASHSTPLVRLVAWVGGQVTDGTVYFRIALRALGAHRFRSFLTTVSILIGGFSIVLMSSLASSGLATLSRGIEDLGGARLVFLGAKNPERAQRKTASYGGGMTIKDREALFAAVPHVVGRTMYVTMGKIAVSADGNHFAKVSMVATDGRFLDTYRMNLAKGRGFSDEESRNQAKVCVVGHKTAVRMFDGDAVGKWLVRYGGLRCRIVGQLANEDHLGIHMGFDWLDLVVWPMGTIGAWTPEVLKGAEILFKTDDVRSNEIVKRVANSILVERHNGVDDFEIFDLAGMMEKWHQTIGIMESIVGFIAGIALLVGGIGVMNMMLVSVSERVREIGIRKALGATPADIGRQFVVEAMLLSGFGGGLGAALGMGGTVLGGILIHHFKPSWQTHISEPAVTVAVVSAVLIGLLFGYWPAKSASRLDPVTAIRTNN